MARTPKFQPVQLAIEKGLEKLRKWYKAIDETDVYFICLGNYLFYFYSLFHSHF